MGSLYKLPTRIAERMLAKMVKHILLGIILLQIIEDQVVSASSQLLRHKQA